MRPHATHLILLTACLITATLGSALPLAATPAANGPPQQTTRTFYMNLTGTATLPRNQTVGTYQVTVNVTGSVTTRGNHGGGNGAGFSGDDLTTHVSLTYQDANGTVHTAEDFTTVASIHATRSPYLGQGLDGFRFNLETHGRAGPILHVGLHGNTTGTENGTYDVVSHGHANVKHDHGADNYLLALMGTSELR